MSKLRAEGFGVILGCYVCEEPVYIPIEYRDTPLKTVEATQFLLRQALRRYDLLEVYESKLIPACSDGALVGVTKDIDSSKCMSHNMNCVIKTMLYKDYMGAELESYWKGLQQFWNNANHAPNDKTVYFNKWIKSNPKPTSSDVEYLMEFMDEKLTLQGTIKIKPSKMDKLVKNGQIGQKWAKWSKMAKMVKNGQISRKWSFLTILAIFDQFAHF